MRRRFFGVNKDWMTWFHKVGKDQEGWKTEVGVVLRQDETVNTGVRFTLHLFRSIFNLPIIVICDNFYTEFY